MTVPDRRSKEVLGTGQRGTATSTGQVRVRVLAHTRRLVGWLLCAGIVSAFSARAEGVTDFPSPLEGPGRPSLERSQLKPFTKAESLHEKGRTQKALKQLAKAGPGPAQQLLRLQIDYDPANDQALPALQELAEASPGYAAAWTTLFVAADTAADEELAYAAAGRVVELWPGSVWAQRADDSRRRTIDNFVALAVRSLETQAPEQALVDIERALEVDPENHALVLGRAKCLVRLDRLDEAEAALVRIGDDPSAQMMAGHIAELEGDLVAAMNRYESVPEGTTGRDEALRRVKTRWRLSVVPSYVQSALASSQVSREELAVLLVNLVPEVRAMGSGSVPLLTDILDLASQRDIVTAARLELMSVDRVEHRFEPDRIATVPEIRGAIERLATLVSVPLPVWCGASTVISSCVELTTPVTGKTVTDVVLSLVHGESP